MSHVFRTLDTFDTEYSADSVEWCPAEGFKDIFVCGTYQLEKNEESSAETKSKRFGRIYLFRVTKNGQLKLLNQLEVPAVLDMKWAHIVHKGRILLGVANALGFLQIYQLEKSEVESLTLLSEIRISNEDECLALSLDWCSGRWTNETESNLKIVVSDSTGFVSIIEVEDSLRKSCSWKAHDFEAWIAAFDYWDTNVIYTGGDDCKFQRFDERIGDRVTVGNRVHGSGVTSIHSNGAREHLLCTGSYDEILRLWDTRNLARPISQTNLTGGVWRLKWDPFARRYLLAACMYGGFKLVDTWETEAPSIIAEYTEHESIAYGCDWSFSTEELNPREDLSSMELLIGTCSFYDHVLKLSALALPAT